MALASRQLCFFAFQRPLEERLGKGFFKTIPRVPGVYLFRDVGARVLYVGQSKNLRQRLGYYKNAQPEREPAKILRLVQQIDSVEVVPCASPEEAQLRENELIQQHRPRYNVANAKSVIYSYFLVLNSPEGWILSLEFEPSADTPAFGAFRNRGLCRRVLFALARTLWIENNSPLTVSDFPLELMNRRINRLECPGLECESRRAQLHAFFKGEDTAILKQIEGCHANVNDRFTRQFLEADLLCLSEFFEFNCQRNRELREQFGIRDQISKYQVDSLILRRRLGV